MTVTIYDNDPGTRDGTPTITGGKQQNRAPAVRSIIFGYTGFPIPETITLIIMVALSWYMALHL